MLLKYLLSIQFYLFLGILNLMYYQSKATLPLLYIFIAGAVLNVFLNFILIPNFSFIGASYATVLSFLVMFNSI